MLQLSHSAGRRGTNPGARKARKEAAALACVHDALAPLRDERFHYPVFRCGACDKVFITLLDVYLDREEASESRLLSLSKTVLTS